MFRSHQRTSRGPPERGRNAFRSFDSKARGGSRGAGRVSSGRVEKKTPAPKSSIVPRGVSPNKKLEALKTELAAKGILYDGNYIRKQKQKGEVPEPAADDASLYRQKMSITPIPERKCTETEIEKIQDALLEALEPLENGCFPQFYGSYTVKGVLVLSCANEQTKQWLEKTVPQLQPWKNGKLCVKLKGEVSQGTKVLLKTPKLFAKTDPKKVLQMLSTQNKTLETNVWKNISVKSEDSGQTLVYVVDNKSLEAIRALNNKVYLGLGNVELVILNDEEDGKRSSADADMRSEEEADKKASVDDDKQTAVDAEMKNQEDEKQTSVDAEMENQEDGDKQTSVDAEMKNQEDSDKPTSVDAEMKNQDDNKQTSVDAEMKNPEEDDKQTSIDTEMKNQKEDVK